MTFADTLKTLPAITHLAGLHLLDTDGRMRLLRVVIWLATLFFAAMLFVPLLREAARRMSELPSGTAF